MKRDYYSIKDIVANEFGDLVFAKNDEVASRLFARVLKSNSNLDPSDLELYCIGYFDDETGCFFPNSRKVIIGDDTSDVDSLS